MKKRAFSITFKHDTHRQHSTKSCGSEHFDRRGVKLPSREDRITPDALTLCNKCNEWNVRLVEERTLSNFPFQNKTKHKKNVFFYSSFLHQPHTHHTTTTEAWQRGMSKHSTSFVVLLLALRSTTPIWARLLLPGRTCHVSWTYVFFSSKDDGGQGREGRESKASARGSLRAPFHCPWRLQTSLNVWQRASEGGEGEGSYQKS